MSKTIVWPLGETSSEILGRGRCCECRGRETESCRDEETELLHGRSPEGAKRADVRSVVGGRTGVRSGTAVRLATARGWAGLENTSGNEAGKVRSPSHPLHPSTPLSSMRALRGPAPQTKGCSDTSGCHGSAGSIPEGVNWPYDEPGSWFRRQVRCLILLVPCSRTSVSSCVPGRSVLNSNSWQTEL